MSDLDDVDKLFSVLQGARDYPGKFQALHTKAMNELSRINDEIEKELAAKDKPQQPAAAAVDQGSGVVPDTKPQPIPGKASGIQGGSNVRRA